MTGTRKLFAFFLLNAGSSFAQAPPPDRVVEGSDDPQMVAPQIAVTNEVQYGYVGSHPIPYDNGTGICPQAEPHFHSYPPFDRYLFRESGGWFYFVGDVADFGYTGEVWGYRGNHPIPGAFGGGFCYMDWPHRHPYPPDAGAPYSLTDGYYSYAGPWGPDYYTTRSSYAAYYGSYYRNNYYGSRYYTSRPPPTFRSVPAANAPGVYRPGTAAPRPGGGTVTVIAAPRSAMPHPSGGGQSSGGPMPVAPQHQAAPAPTARQAHYEELDDEHPPSRGAPSEPSRSTGEYGNRPQTSAPGYRTPGAFGQAVPPAQPVKRTFAPPPPPRSAPPSRRR